MQTFQTVISPDVVDVLRHEHEQIRRLCDGVRDAGSGGRPGALAALRRAVHLHQIGEVAVAHPAARNCGPDGDDIARTSQTEGARIEESLTVLDRRGAGHADFDTGFAALSDRLLDHAAQQEKDEFPLLRRWVPVQRLHMMAGAMHDARVMAAG
jgi:hypothetical protein